MTLIGRLHPLLIHFPIALVIVAGAAECAASVTGGGRWRALAIGNVRAGAAFAVLAALAGWRLASQPGMDVTPLLEWHRWVGTTATAATIAAAAATLKATTRSSRALWTYRAGLAVAVGLTGVAGHLGGVLVWGASFLRP